MGAPSVRAIVAALVVAGAVLAAAPARAQLPIFDAHIHYSRPDWDAVPPERVLEILARANVKRALVSSTPDDGTLKLHQRAPRLVVPVLRPYRHRGDMTSWPRDPAVAAYVGDRLRTGVYRGIGEFHLSSADADAPTVRKLAELAAAQGLFLHAHVDDVTVEKMLTLYPKARILWAHAGMSAPADTVGRLLDRYPQLWVELALRSDVAPGGTLDPAWRALFVRHADRFLVGTDTWVTSRWGELIEGMQAVQRWLAQLPREVAEKIAFRNGDRLFPAP